MTRSRVRLVALALCAMGVGVGALVALPAEAVNTRAFTLDSAADLSAGVLDRVAVTGDGTVVLGAETERLTAPETVGSVWSLLEMGDGSVLAGTGVDGRVYRVQGRDVTLYAETGAVVVTSLTRADDGSVYAGTLPDAKLFRLNAPQGGRPQAPTLVATLPGAQHIWAVQWDRARRVVLCATGPEGKLFAVDPAVTGRENFTVLFDSEEPHLYAMAPGRDGEVLLGAGGGHAIVFGVRGAGRARVIARLTGDEVKGVALAGEDIVAVSNEFTDPPEPPRRTVSQSRLPAPGGPTTARPRAGKGYAWRVHTNGYAERVLSSETTHYTALAWDGARRETLLGTGVGGRVIAVAEDRTTRLLFDVDEQGVSALGLTGATRLFGTSDSGAFYRVLDARPSAATWNSRVLDATVPARWGAVRWRGAGALDWESRSGNSDTPDATWTAWEALDADGVIRSPAGRYVQVRARFTRDPGTVIRAVTVYYLPENQRAVLLDVTATAPETKVGEARRNAVKLGWKVDNADGDELRYRLRFRGDGETTWRALLRNQEWLTATNYEWPTEGLPEGWYRVEVEASDESANPDDAVTRDRRASEPVLVDATAPVVSVRVENGRVLGDVRDGASAVLRMELAVDGGEWRPVRCADGVLDERGEAIDLALPAGIVPGEHALSVRAYDEAGNVGVGSARFRR